MVRIAVLVALVAFLSGCQRGQEPEGSESQAAAAGSADEAETPYQRDVARICNAEERSGALEAPEGERWMIVAQWLGPALETQDARELLAAVSRAAPAEKAATLDREAAKAGLDACPTARAWGP